MVAQLELSEKPYNFIIVAVCKMGKGRAKK
jgi:hypothetical protein